MLHQGTPSRPNHSPNGVRFTGRSTSPMWEIASASARRPAALAAAARRGVPPSRARSSAAQVCGPQAPSTSSPWSAWNARTAEAVATP